MKRRYELTVIFSPQLSSTDLIKANNKLETLISKSDGKIVKKEDWGSKDFATPIKKQVKGFYKHLQVGLEVESISKLDKNLKLFPEILRFLLVLSDKQ